MSLVATEVLAEANVRCIDYFLDRISQLDFEPQVSGKVGWLVGWLGGPCSAFLMTVEFYQKASCWAEPKMQNRSHGKFPL